jgi:hypothetical protein
MKNFTGKRIILVVMTLLLAVSLCEAQKSKRGVKNQERGLFGKSLNTKTVKYREAPSIVRAKKKQEANQRKLDKEYEDYVRQNRKRAVEIQSPEVRERMIENRKEADLKYKAKKKSLKKATKKSRKKYR